MPDHHSQNQKPVDELATRIQRALKEDFFVVGRTHIFSWRALLLMGLLAGVAAGVIVVSNQSGRFERGKAASSLTTLTLQQAQDAAKAAHARADAKAALALKAKADADTAHAALKTAKQDLQTLLQNPLATAKQKTKAQNKVTTLKAADTAAQTAATAAQKVADNAAAKAAAADALVQELQSQATQSAFPNCGNATTCAFTFSHAGVFPVNVTVTDANRHSTVAATLITVSGGGGPPPDPGGGTSNCYKAHFGCHDQVGLDVQNACPMPPNDVRLLCVNNQWYDCGWEGEDPSWDIKASQNYPMGSWFCDLAHHAWVHELPSPPLPGNNASCGAIDAPVSVAPGQNFPMSITMSNTGTKPWTSASPHQLITITPAGGYDGSWGAGASATISDPVNPGHSVTFNLTPTALNVAGAYTLRWKMIEQGVELFGPVCTKDITVNPSPTGD